MPRQNDASITGEIVVYRRIPPKGDRVTWDDQGQPSPTSQNFKDKDNELSVYMAHETKPELVLAGHDGYGLVQFRIEQVRKVYGAGIIICRDDLDPQNGHILICCEVTNGMARQFKKEVEWVQWPARLSPDQW